VIFVRWTTGARLEDLHDVEANGTKDDGDVLAWNATASRWEPKASGESVNGLPVGGDTGELLVKESSVDYDAGWTNTLDVGNF